MPQNAFLRALVVRYRTETPEGMLPYYVARSPGYLARLSFAEIKPAWDYDRRLVGHFCGDWECGALAMQEISAEQAEWLRKTHAANHSARKAGGVEVVPENGFGPRVRLRKVAPPHAS